MSSSSPWNGKGAGWARRLRSSTDPRNPGQRVVLRREELSDTKKSKDSGQYKRLLRVPRAEEIDQWSWEWSPERGLGRG